MNQPTDESQHSNIGEWWAKRRMRYNKGLVISGIAAFACIAIISCFWVASPPGEYGPNDPYDKGLEITIFTTFFQGIGYLIMMGIANIFYNLGKWADKNFNSSNSEQFRERLFNLGYWFSCSLPFLVPLLVVLQYFF